MTARTHSTGDNQLNAVASSKELAQELPHLNVSMVVAVFSWILAGGALAYVALSFMDGFGEHECWFVVWASLEFSIFCAARTLQKMEKHQMEKNLSEPQMKHKAN